MKHKNKKYLCSDVRSVRPQHPTQVLGVPYGRYYLPSTPIKFKMDSLPVPDTLVCWIVRYATLQRGHHTERRGVFTLRTSVNTTSIPCWTIQQYSVRPKQYKHSDKVRLHVGNRHIGLLGTQHLRSFSKFIHITRECIPYQTRASLLLLVYIKHGSVLVLLTSAETQEPQ